MTDEKIRLTDLHRSNIRNVRKEARIRTDVLSGMINIPSNSFTCNVLFDQMFVDDYLAFISINSSNNDNPINYIITNKTKSGFTVKFESEISYHEPKVLKKKILNISNIKWYNDINFEQNDYFNNKY